MSKKIILLWALCLSLVSGLHAQKQIWGACTGVYGHPTLRHGYLYRTDSAGNNLTIVHVFDSLHGKGPGELVLGSNGKLYGCTAQGGSGQYPAGAPGQTTNGGTLFEYDPVLDSLRILYEFDPADAALPYDAPTPHRLLEYSPGVFYGTLQSYGRIIFKYTVATGTVSIVTTVPNFTGGPQNSTYTNYVNGRLSKAANGFVYAASTHNSACPVGMPGAGTLLRLNTANNTLSTVYLNPCNATNGMNYSAPGLEHNGKLYGVALGGNYGAGAFYQYPGYGVIYEFNPGTNAYAKKADFLGGAGGYSPYPVLLKADNGKFYGTAGGGSPYVNALSQSYPSGSGIIFEFDPATDLLSPVHEFRTENSIYDEGEYGELSLKAGDGTLYGISTTGLFAFTPSTGDVEPRARISSFAGAQNLVELCRKPAYIHNPVTQYTVCAGAHFTYDLQNDNATAVTWLHNGSPEPGQTSPVLEFASVTAADAGTWACILTNACGTSTPPAIILTVNPAGPGTVTSTISPAGTQLICPGSSITLSGNNGGTWNTGATTPVLTVNQPGEYRVTNTNACGQTYSNTIVVDTIPSPPVPVAGMAYFNNCPGSTLILNGNDNGGVWNTGATTPTLSVSAVPGVPYYILQTHTCGTDTSNVIQLYPNNFIDTSATPVISTNGPVTFCQGGSVTLTANTGANANALWAWVKMDLNHNLLGTLGANQPLTVTQPGIYVLRMDLPSCGITHTDTVYVTVDMPLQTPVITASGATTFCAGDTLLLQSDVPAGGQWNTGENTQQIAVTQSGTYSATYTNTCGSVTSNAITVTVQPVPAVTYVAPVTQFCTTANTQLLTGGTPAGGSYSGPGVNGGQYMVPSVAGAGTHTLTYTYSNGTCSASATQPIQVLVPQTPLLLSNQTGNMFCEGGSLLLFQTQYPSVNWSTGDVGVVLFVTQPGTYSYTVTDVCGTVTSNSITAIMNPVSPAVSNPQTICQGETYTINGHTYSSPGTYTDHFANVYGCDSSVITQLTVTQAPSSVNPQTVCAGETYTFNGHMYAVSGTYTDTLQTVNGCDSLVLTQLTVTPAPNSMNLQTICAGGSYTFNGHTYTAAGSYVDVFQTGNGCDSTVTTQLTVTPAPGGTNPQTVCAGESYSINGHTYFLGGIYTDTLQTAGGCDSIVTTQLTVLPAAGSSNPQTLCAGESYTFNGHSYTTAGTYTDVLQTAAGCDSIVTTILTVTQVPVSVTQNGTLLSGPTGGDAYQWFNCNTGTALPGATTANYTATVNGSYAVQVTVDGCADTSACQTVSTVSVAEWETGTTVLLYPNPAHDAVWIQSDVLLQTVRVYNSVGQCVLYTQKTNRLDVATLAPGTYFVQAETAEGKTWRRKFVKM